MFDATNMGTITRPSFPLRVCVGIPCSLRCMLTHYFILVHTQELEVEWEGLRDLKSISKGLAEHKSLVRLNLTHNEVR